MEQGQICRLTLRKLLIAVAQEVTWCWQLDNNGPQTELPLFDKITENAVRFKYLNRVALFAQADQRTDIERSQCSVIITQVSSWGFVMVRYYVIAAHLWALHTGYQETLQMLSCRLQILEFLADFLFSRNLKKKKKSAIPFDKSWSCFASPPAQYVRKVTREVYVQRAFMWRTLSPFQLKHVCQTP